MNQTIDTQNQPSPVVFITVGGAGDLAAAKTYSTENCASGDVVEFTFSGNKISTGKAELIQALSADQSNARLRCERATRMSAMKIKTKTAGSKGRRMPMVEPLPVVMTVGHSTRSLAEFIRLLQAHEVSCVVDVRTVPRSRHNPQFNKTSLPDALKQAGLGYVHLPGLGGLRHAKRDTGNVGWRNTSFRGYADYMQTPEFEQGLAELIELAKQERIALMCAEAVPWRCHRSLIADALLVRGIRTEDIMSPIRRTVHTLTPFAKVRGTAITYPVEAAPDHSKKRASKLPVSRPAENLIHTKT